MLRIVVDSNFCCCDQSYYRISCLCSDIFFLNWHLISSKHNAAIDLRSVLFLTSMSDRYFHFARKRSMGSKSLMANLTDVGTYSLSALCAVSLNQLYNEERERLVKILYLVYPWFYFSTIITAYLLIQVHLYPIIYW